MILLYLFISMDKALLRITTSLFALKSFLNCMVVSQENAHSVLSEMVHFS